MDTSFVGIDRWSGMNFQLYTAMGHAAQAVVGAGLIATPLVPKWVAGFRRHPDLGLHGVPYWERDDTVGAPQVMSINGLLASLASTEVLRLIAGLSDDNQSRHWRYEALEGEVYAREPISARCPSCDLRGRGDE